MCDRTCGLVNCGVAFGCIICWFRLTLCFLGLWLSVLLCRLNTDFDLRIVDFGLVGIDALLRFLACGFGCLVTSALLSDGVVCWWLLVVV